MEHSATSSESNSQPRQYRTPSEIYNDTDPIDLNEEELMVMVIDDPVNFSQADNEAVWRKAMKHEIDSVEKNGTWELTNLPPG